jgi:hypothetical protein
MAYRLTFLILLLIPSLMTHSQQRLGINTTNPIRTLDVKGSSDTQLRIHSTSTELTGEAGLELLTGPLGFSAVDWKLVNDGGILKISYNDNNFTGASTEAFRINELEETGIGTALPNSKLNIDGGTLIAFGGHGFMKIGSLGSFNLAFDNTQILALQNGNPAPLYFQANGGNTHFGLNGGNTYMALGGGGVGVGTSDIDASLTIEDDNFQWTIDNDSDDANQWYIGASSNSWVAGGNQLLFSPTSSSADAALRLMNVTDNDGVNAPVMIHTNQDHTLLLDGNEIDTRGTPLYINYNTEEETYINPSGGRVGIGTTNPQAMLHVNATSGRTMTLGAGSALWHFTPQTGGDHDLAFYYNELNYPYAAVDGVTGQWYNVSDSTAKEKIKPLGAVLEKLMNLKTYTYSFVHDSTHQQMIGVLAQEAESLFPEIVYTNEGQYGVSYAQLAVIGIKAIQEQQALIERLKNKIALLKAAQSGIPETSNSLHSAASRTN